MQNNRYIPTVDGWFSGAGGLECGLSEAGLNVVRSVEYNAAACSTLRANFKHTVDERDARTMLIMDHPGTDVATLTFPCNQYSAIADIHGTRTGDDLFLHSLHRLALRPPEAFVVENVPGMRKFPVVMETLTQLPDYFTTVFCPIDSSIWLPQRRARLIIIATRKRFTFRAPGVGRRKLLRDILERGAQVHVPEYVYRRLKGKYRDKPIISDPKDINALAPTCVAHYAKDRSTRLVKDRRYPMGVRPYSVREYARLQGFPDSWEFSGTEAEQYTQIGNAVSVDVGVWIGNELMRYFNKKNSKAE